MNKEIIKQSLAVLMNNEQGSKEYEVAAFALQNAMGGGHKDVLRQLVETGPVYDGDVASKASRDDLIHWGLASRACVKGEQGFTVANYRGWDVARAGV